MKRQSGQILAGAVLLLTVLLLLVPAVTYWMQNEAKWGVQEQMTTNAFDFASAGVERGYWKCKSSTATFAEILKNVPQTGYNFDTTYTDIAGGSYRIRITSGPLPNEATITAEGRDNLKKQVRAVQEVVLNESIPGAIISGGDVAQAGTAVVHWGPVMALGNISISGGSLNTHYPRKLSAQTVTPYDTNGLTPPNTDGLEWWSGYDVPELPIFDFTTLRSSAASTNTLDCNGVVPQFVSQSCTNTTSHGHTTQNCTNTFSNEVACGSSCTNCVVNNIDLDDRFDNNFVWYWDYNVTLNDVGTNGTFIIRGNFMTNNGDWYGGESGEPLGHDVNMHVPVNAWLEYMKIDTTSKNEFPGDNGYRNLTSNYILGSCGLTCEGSASGCDLGFVGFIYVGGDASIQGDADMWGAVWIVGNWSAAGNNLLFFNDQLVLPTINVVLIRQSWQEVLPKTLPSWP